MSTCAGGEWQDEKFNNAKEIFLDNQIDNFTSKLKKKGSDDELGFALTKNADQIADGFKLGDGPKEETFSFDDFIGINYTETLEFTIYTTTFYKSWFGNIDKEYRELRTTQYTAGEGMNLETAKSLRNIVLTKFNTYLSKVYGCGIRHEDHSSYCPAEENSWEKKVLVFISPKSGKGAAQKNWNQIEKALEASGFKAEVALTESRDWAMNYVKDLPFDKFKEFYMVIVCGGDGMVNEVINGFFNRQPPGFFSPNLRLRIGTLAGGSACGAMTQACKNWGLKQSVENAMYVLTRAKLNNMQITRFMVDKQIGPSNTGDGNPVDPSNTEPQIYRGFHSFAFGMSANNIKNSEKFRYAGEGRYTLGAMQNILFSLPKRKMKIWVTEEKVDELPDINVDPQGWELIEDEMYEFLAVWYPHFTGKYTITTKVTQDSDFGEACIVPTKCGWTGVIGMFNAAEKAQLETCENVMIKKWRAFKVELSDDRFINDENTFCAIDGDWHPGQRVQACIEESIVRQCS